MNNETHDFKQFMKRREEIANAYVNGEGDPIAQISTDAAPATFFGPGGGYIRGAKDVSSAYQHGASGFEAGGESHLEILHIEVSDDVACWVGIQRATVKMKGHQKAVPMDLRITEIFRREDGEWKLVHRHADTQVEAPDEKK